MTIPIWILAIGIPGLFIGGFLVCAFLTTGRMADASETLTLLENSWEAADAALAESEDAHSRCADALQQNRDRIESALLQITPRANATVRRIERILRGEA